VSSSESTGESIGNSAKRRPPVGVLPRWTAALLGIEIVALLALAFSFIYFLLTGSPRHITAAFFEIALFLGGAFGLLAATKGMRAGRHFGRSPAIVANIIALPIAYSQGQAGNFWIAIPLALIAMAIILGITSTLRGEGK
jgi:hypothetical protein